MTLRILPWVLAFFALSFTFFAIQSGDAIMYLNLARDFVFTEGWPLTDPYTYSLDHPPLIWTHEYLSFALFYGAYQTMGFGGLIVLKMLIWGLVFLLVLRAPPKEKSTSWVFIGLWILAVIAGSFRFIERTSMFSDLILVWLCGYLLERERLDRRTILTLAGVFLVWAQIHPAFPLGLALVGLWALHHVWRGNIAWQRLPWLLSLPLALMIHPDGVDGLLYPFRFAFNEASVFKKYNFEWLPSYHFLFRFAPETVAFWLLTALSLLLIVRERAWSQLRTWFALFAMACAVNAVRFVPWSSFALVLCLKPWAEFRLVTTRPGRVLGPALTAFLLLIAIKNFAFGYSSSSGERLPRFGLDPKFFPEKTVDFYLKNTIQGRLYNAHDFGSYLIWRGATPVFHHGFMTDVAFYENDVMGVFRSQRRFLELAAKYNWTMLLVEKHGNYRYFYQILAPLPEWKIVAEDDAAYLIYRLPN